MKKFRNQKGYTGIDIAISVIVIFIFVSLISLLIYRFNSSSNELKLRSTATYLAVDEIEKIKAQGFSAFEGLNKSSVQDKEGNSLVNQLVQEGFYRTIIVEDYTDLREGDYIPNIVKKITVRISYKFKAKDEKVELSTILTKEN